jgi:hypothetical protein
VPLSPPPFRCGEYSEFWFHLFLPFGTRRASLVHELRLRRVSF